MSVNMQRVKTLINHLATISSEPHQLTRLAFSAEDLIARDYLLEICRQQRLKVRIDEIGNVIIRRDGLHNDLPAVAFGSHIDTVVNAGKFDGPLGTVAGLEILLQLCERQQSTRYPLELIIFTCEESSRFNYATLGSKVMCGVSNQADLARLQDKNGIRLATALQQIGLDFQRVDQAKRSAAEFKCFFELHIEQGPRLENENKTIGVVSGIAAPIRCIVKIEGQADHSGATAMNYRHDALLGGAELALALEQAAIRAGHATVATVGQMQAKPGVMNVVPGYCELLVDIRGTDLAARESVFSALQQKIDEVSRQRGLQIELQLISRDQPILLDPSMVSAVEQATANLSYTYEIMPSGAGHDAMHMATLCPTAMIFVPSRRGISHNPLEHTDWQDVEAGIKVLQAVVLQQAELI
ncbi:N-carbamoyl-L-amino-acid hydrolase [Pasteurella testudinis DSM 23072]|uniref:N-carbamoyl-L-amino-acid hydrolase n=1 Tax=Pasteurella testudinis DSM 23072 TaxID=1122938 RepID=A0A1W1UMR8_9PAST|nr:Zn-dependent hydrolase [Pasteurella testudinis]SMB82004.1 N-carbamoyl-L-amino-acid hydrolase [Pasteurella testudinis DSM 23072]SUB52389.1 hydrolase [Pasteurella testudinis]